MTRSSLPTWPVASASLVAGFAVAEATGVRALGGVVLLAGAAWCARRWYEEGGAGRAASLLGVYAGAFAGSHAVAGAVGAWPAVALAAGIAGVAAWAVADRRGAALPSRAAG